MHRFEGRKMQYVNSVGVGVEIGAGRPVETFEFFAFSESRFVYFVRIHDAHAHLDDTKIEACAHTEYVLKSHKMVR